MEWRIIAVEMLRNRCGFLLALVALTLMPSPAWGQQPEGKKRTLVIWGISIGADSKGQDAVNREFERRNPDVNVRILSMGAGRMDPTKLMTSIVGNVAPDVISQDRFSVSDWASRGAFEDLSTLMERDKSDRLTPKPEQYYDATWSEATYNGRVYAIPTGADDRVLYWNRARFKEKSAELRAVGLDPNRAPVSWSELLAYSKVLTERDKRGNLLRAGFMPNFGNSWLYMYSFMNNGQFMTPDGLKCTLAAPENIEALEFMKKGYEILGGYEKAKLFESGFRGGENDAFITGQVAMKIDGDWILGGLARYAPRLDFKTAPNPSPDDRIAGVGRFANVKEKHVTWFGGFSLAIPRGAKNVEDGWRYIKFSSSTEGRLLGAMAQREWDQRRGRMYIPGLSASKEANDIIFAKLKPADPKFADAIKMHIEQGEFGQFRPATIVAQTLWSEHGKAMEAALYGRITPTEALKIGQETVQRELNAFLNKKNNPEINLMIPGQIAIGLVIVSMIGFFVWFKRQPLGPIGRNEAAWGYLFIAPWLIGFLIFTLGPMIVSFFFSFTQYDVLNEARWVGTKNYQDLFGTDLKNIRKAFENVTYLAVVGVPLGLFSGLAIALLLNTTVKGMRFFRAMFYMPAVVPTVASVVLWNWVLTPDPNKGLINNMWQSTLTQWIGMNPPLWLQSADWAKPALVFMGLWGAGGGMVLWIAGLKGVPTTLYEAAGIDGASPRRMFWSVTFPMLSPIIFFNAIMGFIGTLQEFDRVYIIKGTSETVGPDNAMLTPVFHLFQNGFTFFKMGYASSIAWLIFGIILMITFAQFRLAKNWVHYETDK